MDGFKYIVYLYFTSMMAATCIRIHCNTILVSFIFYKCFQLVDLNCIMNPDVYISGM